MTRVPVSSIDSPMLRIQTDQDTMEIAESFRKHGQFFPIRLRKHSAIAGRYEVVFGNRRLAAAKKLGWENISAEIVEASDEDSLIMAFSENIDRRDFSDYEKALLLEKLKAVTGKTFDEIASLIGRSPAFVSQHIAMLDLFTQGLAKPGEIRELLQQLTERHARALARIEDQTERFNTAKLAVKASLGVRELEKICNDHSTKSRTLGVGRRNENDIKKIISEILSGLNSKDLTQFFGPISKRYFSMFSRFPPFEKMDKEESMDYLSNILRQMDDYQVSAENLDVEIFGNFAYATFYELHKITISNKVVKTRTRATIIFAKEEGSWKVVHEHWSSANPSEFMGLFAKVENPRHISRKSSLELASIKR